MPQYFKASSSTILFPKTLLGAADSITYTECAAKPNWVCKEELLELKKNKIKKKAFQVVFLQQRSEDFIKTVIATQREERQ